MLLSRCDKKRSLAIWLSFHLLILLLFLVRGRGEVSGNLFDLIPSSREMKSVFEAERSFSAKNSKTVLFFVIAADFQDAKEQALVLHDRLWESGAFSFLQAESDASYSMEEIRNELGRMKFALLDSGTETLLEEKRYQEISESALALIYSPFSFQGLGNLGKDPFLLSEREGRNLLTSLSSLMGMSPKEGVLSRKVDGLWYVMLRGDLTADAVAMDNKRDIARIMQTCEDLERESGLTVAYSGIPFHSWESSMSAQKELFVITTVSLALVLLLFGWLFQSPVVLLLLFGDIALSALSAIGCVFSVFGSLNVLTLVFGTTLIGTCVDYSVHYALHAWWDGDGASPLSTRDGLFKGIGTSFLSTFVCYGLLLFAPYRLLKEVALFSMTGLTSSFVTSMFLYPVLFGFPLFARRGVDVGSFGVPSPLPSRRSRHLLVALATASALVLALSSLPGLRVHNDLASLYSISEKMRRNESLAMKAMPYASTTYLIVSGENEEEVLSREEAFVAELGKNGVKSVLATSMLLPSSGVQQKRYGLVKGLYDAYLAKQCEILGTSREEALGEFSLLTEKAVRVEDVKDYSLASQLTDRLWIGEREGRCFSAVMVMDADLLLVEEVAQRHEGVWYFNTVRDISLQLDALTRTILGILLFSFVLMVLLLGSTYGWRRSLGYHLSPLVILLVTICLMVLFEGVVDFFTVVALVLSIGLGLDYVVFMMEMKRLDRRQKAISFIAVAVSFVTSLLSFGTLVFSSFRPVHLFGLAVSIGLSSAYAFALLMRKVDGRKEE